MHKRVVIIAIIMFSGYVTYRSQKTISVMSKLTIENIEALARYELPEVEIICDTGGSGRCYIEMMEEGLYGIIRYWCEFTGSTSDYC